MSIVVETKDLKKDYYLKGEVVHALRGINLTVERGESVSYTHLTLPTN